jgi:capping protein beta
MEAAMDLMRRMPPASAETALNALLSLLPDHSLDLLSQVDLPLQVYLSRPRRRLSSDGAPVHLISSYRKSLAGIGCSAGRCVSFDCFVFIKECAFVALRPLWFLPRARACTCACLGFVWIEVP